MSLASQGHSCIRGDDISITFNTPPYFFNLDAYAVIFGLPPAQIAGMKVEEVLEVLGEQDRSKGKRHSILYRS